MGESGSIERSMTVSKGSVKRSLIEEKAPSFLESKLKGLKDIRS
jgi:hypothetical protein